MINLFQKAALCCLFYLLTLGLQAQVNSLKSLTVLDEATGEPIEGVAINLSCDGKSNTYYSDIAGVAQITACEGEAAISFDHPNYHELRKFQSIPESISLKALPAIISTAEINASSQVMSTNIISRMEYGASISFIQSDKINSTDKTSLLNTLNTVPGIKMDERGYGGSRRISIRGSFVRSPFAVRNLGLYYESIPLNSPDGSSPIELIDPDETGMIQVIKGPAGSIYGSGNGGVLFINAAKPSSFGTTISNKFTAGSFGLIRNASSIAYRKSNNWIKASFIHQDYEGYRDQEFNNKDHFILQGGFDVKKKLNYFMMYQHYEGSWGLPGALKLADAEDDPTQASEYSENINASLERTRDLFAIRQNWSIKNRLLSKTSIYFSQYDKLNPYGTSEFFNGLKNEDGAGYGGRSSLQWWKSNGKVQGDAMIGIEWQQEAGNFKEAPNSLANPTEVLRYSNETTFTTNLLFARGSVKYRNFTLSPSVSLNSYDVENKGFSTVLDTSLDANFNVEAEILAGLSLSKTIKNSQFIVAVNQGQSNPGLFELVDVETGILNVDLKAENGFNTEFTFRQFSTNQKTFFEFILYEFNLEESIIPNIDEFERISYSNGGDALHRGLEASFNHRFEFIDDSFVEQISFRSAAAIQNFKNTSDEDYSIPGVPLATLSSGINVLFGRTLSIDINHYWSDRAPLNDENSDYLNAYHLLNTKITWEKKIRKLQVELYAGINNITDTKYTSFPAVNAFGGRYYNPAPALNMYGGIGLAYRFE